MLVSGSVCRWRWHVAISHCLLDTCIVCLQKYLALLSETLFLTGTRVRRGPVRVGIRIVDLIIIWLDLNWLERHYVKIWHRCKCSEVCCFRTLNRFKKADEWPGEMWRRASMPLQHGSRVPTNVPNQQGTYRSAMQRRCDMIKVFCEGNSWKQNVEEIIEKMMGFLEVLLQLMITSQCFFF